jgi:uncharacterized HAD superfamily protein
MLLPSSGYLLAILWPPLFRYPTKARAYVLSRAEEAKKINESMRGDLVRIRSFADTLDVFLSHDEQDHCQKAVTCLIDVSASGKRDRYEDAQGIDCCHALVKGNEGKACMFYAIDIDGTIAHPEPGLIAFHDHDFGLGLTAEELNGTYRQFLQLPQVVELSREALEQSRQRARMTPEVVLSYEPIDHAREALDLLAQHGEITYYTVRAACVEEATRTWLHTNGFPFPQQVVFCRSVLHKLVQLHTREWETDRKIVLIDDRYQQIITDVARLAAGEFAHISAWQEIAHFVRHRLLLVAFGATSLPASTNGLHVVPVRGWRHLAEHDPFLLFR